MLFKPNKCNVIRITRARTPVLFDYVQPGPAEPNVRNRDTIQVPWC